MFPRTVARFAAVQAVCQGFSRPDLTPQQLVEEFQGYRFSQKSYALFDEEALKIDLDFFARLVHGAYKCWPTIEPRVGEILPLGWSVRKMECVTRSILRCAGYEIMEPQDAPKQVIINEYLLVSHGFLTAKGPGFVNAALEKLFVFLAPSPAAQPSSGPLLEIPEPKIAKAEIASEERLLAAETKKEARVTITSAISKQENSVFPSKIESAAVKVAVTDVDTADIHSSEKSSRNDVSNGSGHVHVDVGAGTSTL